MASLRAIATAHPPYVVTQEQALLEAKKLFEGRDDVRRLVDRVYRSSGVEERHFAFPVDYYKETRSFEDRNRDYVTQAIVLSRCAARRCLTEAHVAPEDVDHLLLVTTTGLATPSLDALLVAELGLGPGARRWPLFGLGCAGGAGALARAADVLAGAPHQNALVLAVEVCGQVFTPRATTPTDIVGTALFADGAAAVLLAGAEANGPAPRILATRSHLFEETRDIMGWEFTSDGMRLKLSQDVVKLIKERLRPAVSDFLDEAGVDPSEVRFWALHPGGRKIIDTYRDTFSLSEDDLRFTRGSLATRGNLSSVSVLCVLEDVVKRGEPRPGDIALVGALGPGFAAELLLVGF